MKGSEKGQEMSLVGRGWGGGGGEGLTPLVSFGIEDFVGCVEGDLVVLFVPGCCYCVCMSVCVCVCTRCPIILARSAALSSI